MITLAIIGIVGAMTIPTLIQNYKKQQTTARLKKFYSTMLQVVRLAEIDNGPSSTWSFTKVYAFDKDGVRDMAAVYDYTNNWAAKYILPYLKFSKVVEGEYIPATGNDEEINTLPAIYLNDGSIIYFNLGSCVDITYDKDGTSGPMARARALFKFTWCFDNEYTGFEPYLYHTTISHEDALNKCKNSSSSYCSSLLMYDNWQFKDDYPYKL